jgi:hypothetical protein
MLGGHINDGGVGGEGDDRRVRETLPPKYNEKGEYTWQWEAELRGEDALWELDIECSAHCEQTWGFMYDGRDPLEPEKTLNEEGHVAPSGHWICPYCWSVYQAVLDVMKE